MHWHAKAVNAPNNITAVKLMKRDVGDRRFEVDAAMRAFLVVMGGELPQDALSMAFAAHQHPVQALRRAVNTNLSAKAFALGARKGVLITLAPTDLITSSKGPTNLLSRSPIRKRNGRPRSSRTATRSRACWVTQGPAG